jgi:hypothetical protein
MPKPKKNESLDEFTERFMKSEEAREDFPNEDQRFAVMMSMFKEKHKNKK